MLKKSALFTVFFLLLSTMALSEDMPVRVKADSLKFDQDAGIITANGSVEIFFENVKILSDRARIDTNANVATAEGNVKINQSSYSLTSQMLTYDISGEIAVAFKLRTVLYPSDIKANIYMSAYTLTDLPDMKMGEYGSATTCDYDEPHYHAESRWFDYYPDDKLIGYLVTLYVGPVPILWSPYYVYNIKKRRSPYNFVYGENEVEGKFLKTSFDYFINNSAYGIFYFDSTEKKGPGYGISHDYKLNNENSGNAYYYWINEKDTKINDYVVKLAHNMQVDQYSRYTLLHDSSYMYLVPAGRRFDNATAVSYVRDTGTHKLNYNYNTSNNMLSFVNTEAFNISNSYNGMNTSFKWDESSALKGAKWHNSHDTFHHDQSLFTDDLKLNVNLNYSSYVADQGLIADEKLEPRIDMTYKGPFYSAVLTQNWYVDVDGREYRGDDNYNYIERLPELNVNFNPFDLYYFNLNTSVGAARIHEAQYVPLFLRMRHVTTNRLSLGSSIWRSDPIGFGTTLRSELGLEQFSYSLGDQRYRFTESLKTDTNLWGFFRNNIEWGRARVEGNTPYFFESLGSQHNYIKDSLRLYYFDKTTLDLTAGYNYMNERYDDILGTLTINPNEKLSFRASSGWSVEDLRYRDLNTSVTITPYPGFRNTGNLTYDMNVGKILSANSEVDLLWGDTWQERFHFKMTHYYDFITDTLTLRDIAIVKDLHCWEGYFSYSDYLKEFRWGLSLKAFPAYPFSYSVSPSGNYFNSFMDNMHFTEVTSGGVR